MTGNEVFLFSHQTYSTSSKSADITYPPETVKGSEKMRIAVIGKIRFTTSLKCNLKQLNESPERHVHTLVCNFVSIQCSANLNRHAKFTGIS